MKSETKRKIALAFVLLTVLFMTTTTAGCIGQAPETTIESEQEVGGAVSNISSGVDNLGSILEDIEQSIG